MSERGGAVHVVTTRRTYKGRVYETHLLRRSYREGDRVKNETLGNLSHLPAPVWVIRYGIAPYSSELWSIEPNPASWSR